MGVQIDTFKCDYLQTPYSHNRLKGAKGGCENQYYNFHQVIPKHKDIIVVNLMTTIHQRHMDQAQQYNTMSTLFLWLHLTRKLCKIQ